MACVYRSANTLIRQNFDQRRVNENVFRVARSSAFRSEDGPECVDGKLVITHKVIGDTEYHNKTRPMPLTHNKTFDAVIRPGYEGWIGFLIHACDWFVSRHLAFRRDPKKPTSPYTQVTIALEQWISAVVSSDADKQSSWNFPRHVRVELAPDSKVHWASRHVSILLEPAVRLQGQVDPP